MKQIYAVCAIAKAENNYIREWVEYYLSLGFDKVILYDNNNIDGEYLADPIKDYIENNQVDLIDARGKKSYQLEAYNDCYSNYADSTDWILFVDIDEFLALENASTIQEFVEKNNLNKYDAIAFRWRHYSDNNLVQVKDNNYSVLTRFTTPSCHYSENYLFKELIKTRIPDIQINSVHVVKEGPSVGESDKLFSNPMALISKLNICYLAQANLQHAEAAGIITPMPGAYIKHFKYKTIQEYLDYKVQRGYPMPFRKYGTDLGLFDFFNANQVTDEKLDFVKNWLQTANITDEKRQQLTEDLNKIIEWGFKGRLY